ncbi:MAG: FAD-dependent oxidoreductase [candidate division Zixibacteria bacterium]|nr:FAD-dependent oxidoreductase [candidate division Zixibacteria bacterium]
MMEMVTVKINDSAIECAEGNSILEVADSAGIYIPRLCYHPDLPSAKDVIWAESIYQDETKIISEKSGEKTGDGAHCNLCLVDIDGNAEPVNACITSVEDGMVIRTDTSDVSKLRKQALSKILAGHPHSCLTCAQKEGCSRTDCSSNVPVEERCCRLLGQCELEKVSDFIGIPGDTPKYIPKQYPVIKDDPLFDRDYNLCIGCLRCVRACTDLRKADVMGAIWKDDRIWVGTKNAAGLKEAECRFCGACVEVCPTGALLDKEAIPAVRRDAPLPCVGTCPAGIDIPHYLKLIALGRYSEALAVIKSSVPFPGILGYVCFHPCETNCRRGEVDQAVAICDLKRFVADKVPIEELGSDHKHPDSGKKIAIIGSGPAGLTAAYYLGLLGHQVDIFDNAEKPGGMLRHAIPDYRLPPEILDRELEALKNMGINFNMNSRIGVELGIPELKSRGYDSILVAAGTSASKALEIENYDLEGVYLGLDFLKSAKLSRKPELSGDVVVIGGGNVAIDAAMTALRLGADKVRLICLESSDEMPAHDWEIAQAEEEGVTINPSWGPKRFIAIDNKLAGIELRNCTKVFDERGAFNPQYDENELSEIPADYVIVTIGQETDRKLMSHLDSQAGSTGDRFKADDNFTTNIDCLFVAGDLVRGPSSVVEAIADGRRVADVIDKYLGGSGLADDIPDLAGLDDPALKSDESINRPRQNANIAEPSIRKSNFNLISKTFDEQIAKHEAQRCLQCHLRQLINPITLPPEHWLILNQENVESVPRIEGVFQLLDADKKVIRITGAMDLRESLKECLANPGEAKYYIWEEDPMYTKRESELIQQHLQKHGELPGDGMGDDLDDLF